MDIKYSLEKGLSISTDQEVATLYSEVEYIIYFENTTNADIYNLIIPIIIPTNTKYKENSLHVNDEKYTLKNNNVFTIPVFRGQSILKIKYKVYIDQIPMSGSVENWIKLRYSKSINSESDEEIKSNKVVTKVKGVKLKVNKKIDKETIYIDDEIYEDILIRNDGNIKAFNLVVKEIVPENIIVKSILVNDSELIDININNIPIGILEPLKSVRIRLYGKVIGVNKIIENLTTKVNYDYFDEYADKYVLKNYIEENYKIFVSEGHIGNKFNCENSLNVNRKNILINEKTEVELLVYNTGNIIINNANLKLLISKGVNILKLEINNKEININDINIIDGINLKNIIPDGEIKLKAIIQINDLEIKEKHIKAIVKYEYFDKMENQFVQKVYESNEEKIMVYGAVLINPNGQVINKKCNKNVCTVGDALGYTLSIKNNGNRKCNKLIFKEQYNSNSEFVEGSFNVNDKVFVMADIFKGIYIGSLDIGESIEISYKLKISKNVKSDWFISTSELKYTQEDEEGKEIIRTLDITCEKIRIINPILNEVEKIEDIHYCKKEYIENYSISLQNMGNVELSNIKIHFKKSKELEFKEISVNDKKIQTNSLLDNMLGIPNINKGEKMKLEILLDMNKEYFSENMQIDGEVSYNYIGADGEKLEKILNLTSQKYHIVYANFNAIAIMNKNYLLQDEEVDGIIEIQNTGNIDLHDIKVIQFESNDVETLSINIKDTKCFKSTIKPNEKLIIPISININNIDKKNVIKFQAKLNALYKFKNKEVELNEKMEFLEIEILQEKIKCILESNKNDFLVGDIGCFNIVIENSGNHILKETFLQLNIFKEIDLVDDEICIKDNLYRCSDIVKGISIGDIDTNERIYLKYRGKIKDINLNKEIKTYYKIKGYYNIKSSHEIIYKEYKSEILTNSLENVSLKTFLKANKNLLLKGEKIKYTSTLINDGTIPIDINYKLDVGKELEEIKESTKLNTDNVKEFDSLIKIQPNDGIIIEKNFVYKDFRGIDSVLAQGIVEIYYKCNDEQHRGSKEIKTEILETEVTNTNFKDMLIEDVIDTTTIYPQVGEIIKIYLTPAIVSKNIRKIQREYNYNFKDIIGYKLEFVGKVNYTIEYISYENNQEIHLITNEKFFTSNMLLPQDFIEGEEIIIEPKVLDINYKIIEESKLFINMNILINTSI